MKDMLNTGVFSIVGRPNTGKSTLVNRLCGVKVAIVSSKPQTTRTRITGIYNDEDSQLVFIDTPGLHKAKNRLGDQMVQRVYETVESVDAAVLVVEPVARIGVPEKILMDKIKSESIPCILVINKIDTLEDKTALLPVIAAYAAELAFRAVVPVSAKTGLGVDELTDELKKLTVQSPPLYPEGVVSDQPEEYMTAEIIREKLLWALDQEVPHGLSVMLESVEDKSETLREIYAVIFCEKQSHKGIIIGRHGELLKKIGSEARKELEHRFGKKVMLHLWVKVKEDWRDRPDQIRTMINETI